MTLTIIKAVIAIVVILYVGWLFVMILSGVTAKRTAKQVMDLLLEEVKKQSEGKPSIFDEFTEHKHTN